MPIKKVLTRSPEERVREMFVDGTSQKMEHLREFADEKISAPLAEQQYIADEIAETQERVLCAKIQDQIKDSLAIAQNSGFMIEGNEPNQHSFVASKGNEEAVRDAANDLIEQYKEMGFSSSVAEFKQGGELIIEVAPKVPAEFQGRDLLKMPPEDLEDARDMAKVERSREVPSDHPERVSATTLQQGLVRS